MLTIPSTFKPSKRAPSLKELDALYNFLEPQNGEIKDVLEFSCGITSYVIYNACDKFYNYTAIESFQPCIDMVKQHCPDISVISKWTDIPDNKFDLVFVDGSSGYPLDLKPLSPTPKCPIPFRNDAIKYVEPKLSKNAIVIIHDYNHHDAGYRLPRKYLEDNNYELIWHCDIGNGLGAYTK